MLCWKVKDGDCNVTLCAVLEGKDGYCNVTLCAVLEDKGWTIRGIKMSERKRSD